MRRRQGQIMLRMAMDGWPEGWISALEIRELQAVVASIFRGKVAEIGAWYGRSTAALAQICRANGNHLLVIDTWQGSASDSTRDLAASGPVDPFDVFRDNLSAMGLWNAVETRRMTSHAAAATVPDRSLDAIFLDADHAYDSVREDLARWWSKLKPGGTFLGHDYREEFSGVIQAVCEHTIRHGLTPPRVVDSLWRLTKPQTGFPTAAAQVTVVTPTYRTDPKRLEQCCRSVAEQSYSCRHFVIADGESALHVAERFGAETLRIPGPCRDRGNTARSIGSLLAVAQGCDLLAWLDADNWYLSDHIEWLVRLQKETGAEILSTGRTLCDSPERLLGECPESDGQRYVDPSCYLLTRTAFSLGGLWATIPAKLRSVGPRAVWERVKRSGLRRAHVPRGSVVCRKSRGDISLGTAPTGNGLVNIEERLGGEARRIFDEFVSRSW